MKKLWVRLCHFAPTNIRTITWLYIISGTVVISELLVAYTLTNREARLLENDAYLINRAGYQSMLSQRILLTAHRLEQGTSEHLLQQLQADISSFRETHLDLMTNSDLPAAIRAQLTESASPSKSDDIFATFASASTRLLHEPATKTALAELVDLVEHGVSKRLVNLSEALKNDTERNLKRLHRAWANSIAIAVIILALEAAFVFLPSQRMIQKAFQEIRDKKEDLELSNTLLQSERNKLLRAVSETDTLRQQQAEFTYAISHDMKAPANTIKLIHSELIELLKDHDDDEVTLFLDMLIATTNRMSLLVEDVLDYTSTLGAEVNFEPVDLQALCQDVIADLNGDIKQAQGTIDLGSLPTVQGSKSQLRMLFQNLVSNALKFRDQATPSVISIQEVEGAEGEIAVQVSDNGIGIAPENQSRIFGLFDRLHLQEEYAGTGLGLALCNRIASNHSGRIGLHSVLGQGSDFTVFIPKEATV